jgi:hypothetical protein
VVASLCLVTFVFSCRSFVRCVFAQNVADKFVNDLRASVAEILQVGRLAAPSRLLFSSAAALARVLELIRVLPCIHALVARAQNPSMYKDGAAAIYGATRLSRYLLLVAVC